MAQDDGRRDTVHRDADRYRALLAAERESAELYRRLAEAARGERQAVLLKLADVETRHAAHWEAKLRELGTEPPSADSQRYGLRTRLLGRLARWFGVSAVLPVVERAERADAGMYDEEPDAAPGMAIDERSHARALAGLDLSRGRVDIAARERWHRSDRSGALRAGVFGVNDGLVSNTALVMGFAGSGAPGRTILFAGIAGLLAGAFSMAAGEYISMTSQREMYEREINLESQEIREMPEEESEELSLIYQAKGLSAEDADQLAKRIMKDQDVALDTMAREELGLDPDELGSPWGAALASFLAFTLGALVPVVPYLLGSGTAAFVAAVAAAVAALFVVGTVLGLLSGRPALRSGARQLLVGGFAAGVTYGVGHAIGVSVT